MSHEPSKAPRIDPNAAKARRGMSIFPRDACPKNPAKDEKITIKAVVAEAFLGLNPR